NQSPGTSNGALAGSEQAQESAPAATPDAVIQPSESAPLPDGQNVPDAGQAAAHDQLATDAYFAAVDFSVGGPRAELAINRDAAVIGSSTDGGSEAAVAAFLLGFAVLGQHRGNDRTRPRWWRWSGFTRATLAANHGRCHLPGACVVAAGALGSRPGARQGRAGARPVSGDLGRSAAQSGSGLPPRRRRGGLARPAL